MTAESAGVASAAPAVSSWDSDGFRRRSRSLHDRSTQRETSDPRSTRNESHVRYLLRATTGGGHDCLVGRRGIDRVPPRPRLRWPRDRENAIRCGELARRDLHSVEGRGRRVVTSHPGVCELFGRRPSCRHGVPADDASTAGGTGVRTGATLRVRELKRTTGLEPATLGLGSVPGLPLDASPFPEGAC